METPITTIVSMTGTFIKDINEAQEEIKAHLVCANGKNCYRVAEGISVDGAFEANEDGMPQIGCMSQKCQQLNGPRQTKSGKEIEFKDMHTGCIFCFSCRTKFVLKIFVHLSALTSRGIHGVT